MITHCEKYNFNIVYMYINCFSAIIETVTEKRINKTEEPINVFFGNLYFF